MSDFVTLNCPSCGGKLTVQKNSPTYICDYCGTEHKLREEDIEFFGRCPRCHRNDRVEKITAIVNRHDPLAVKFPPPNQLNLDKFLRRTDLATQQKLNMLKASNFPEDVNKKRSNYFFIGMFVIFFQACFIVFLGVVLGTKSGSNFGVYYFLLSILVSVVLAVLGVSNAVKSNINQREQLTQTQKRKSTLENELFTQLRELHTQKEILTRQLKSRYDQIYYCHRDDLLFIPGESDYASCDDFEGYLTSVLKTSIKA